ncbi:solute carrier family 22 member 5 isoform X2 [Oreochromis niloticus]|uniref:Solute carrier family 22 member 4 n=1 Tax=Oreochromis niloticus TaxID=8128 RepID=A0A669C9Y1_ORENI|nr:solute carrier family 22 member 5 isoform X2 [Oreochromis niloticus]
MEMGPNLERSSCSRYELHVMQNLSALRIKPNLAQIHNYSEFEASAGVMLSNLKQEECKDGWIYGTEHYESTVVTEFNLVCDNNWKQPMSSLIYFLGSLCGCFLSGQISDRFGRKPVLFSSIFILSVFSIALSFAQSWAVFNVLFFMVGMCQLSIYILLLVLGSELLVGVTRVLFSSLALSYFYVAGMMAFPGTAYVVRNWRHLSLFMALPGLACFPFWWLVPESPRWLLSKGRFKEAELLLRFAALENGVEFPSDLFRSAESQQSEQSQQPEQPQQSEQPEQSQQSEQPQQPEVSGYLGLLRNMTTRSITLVVWFLWFSLNVSYFGLSFNMTTIYGNPFLNYALLSLMEMPAHLVSWFSAKYFPRRMSFIGFSLLGALPLFLIQITLHKYHNITLTLVLMGKFGVLASEGILHLLTGELSPTVIRNTMLSSAALFSRVGSSVAPYLLQLAVFYEFLPWLTVGSLSVISVLVSLFLPESFGKPLPDTIDQMQVIKKFKFKGLCHQKVDGNSPGVQEPAVSETSLSEIKCSTAF